MHRVRLLSITTSLALALVGSTATAGDLSGPKSTICHRTGDKLNATVFRGVVITISKSALSTHLSGHGDAVITPGAMKFFARSKDCGVDAAGNLFDGKGNPISPIKGGGDTGGGTGGGETPPPPPPVG